MLGFSKNFATVVRLSGRAIMASALAVGMLAFCASEAKADLKALQEEIARSGKLPGGSAYWSRAGSLYRRGVRTVAGNKIARNASALSSTGQVGDHPDGFGKGFHWDRKDDEILLVLFINAADPLGVSLSGFEAKDQIQIQSAAGIGSFSEDKGNPMASSIVGLLATGAKAGLGLSGNPELIPVVDKAEEFAKEQFKATGARHKRRDPYGVDPGTGHKAKQEGGVLICLPLAGGTYYSGNSDHRERWLKDHAPRTDDMRPDHVRYGFYLVRHNHGHNARLLRGGGQLYVLAWDHKFEDNAGYYKVFVHIKKGKSTSGGPVVVKRVSGTRPPWQSGGQATPSGRTPPTRPPVSRPTRDHRRERP